MSWRTHLDTHYSGSAGDNLCRDDCPYRALYSGSQASLTDVIAKQAEALDARLTIRGRLVSLMRRAFPREFAEAERKAGRRMSDMTDDELLAFLDAFVGEAVNPFRGEGLPARSETTETTTHPAVAEPSVVVVPPAEPTLDPGPGLGSIFEGPSAHVPTTGGLSGIFGENAPEPVVPREDAPEADRPDDPSGLGGLFSDEPPYEEPPDSAYAEEMGRTDPSSAELSGLFAAPDGLAGLFEAPSGAPPEAVEPVVAEAEEAAVPPPPSTPQAPEPASTEGPSSFSGEPRTSGRSDARSPMDGILKPQLFPNMPRSKRKKKASAPAPTVEVPAEVADKLLASVAVPRPVFLSDLVAVAGSAEVASSWEATMRAQSVDSMVRFVAPKGRHAQRGALVMPFGPLRTAAVEFAGSWWQECLDRYRGGVLYELAVVLHRVGPQVVTSRFQDEVAVLRLKTKAGPVALVVVLGNQLGEGASTREALFTELDSLVGERLSTLAVLSTTVAGREDAEAALAFGLANRPWDPPMQVVVGYSWDWGTGATGAMRALVGS